MDGALSIGDDTNEEYNEEFNPNDVISITDVYKWKNTKKTLSTKQSSKYEVSLHEKLIIY